MIIGKLIKFIVKHVACVAVVTKNVSVTETNVQKGCKKTNTNMECATT